MHCDRAVQAVGFEPLPPEWPSCYFNKKLQMFLLIYMDDFKLAGKIKHMQVAWEKIKAAGIVLDDPTPLNHFLACQHIKRKITRADGTVIITMEYDFEDSLRNSVARYVNLAAECGVTVTLKERHTHTISSGAYAPAQAPSQRGAMRRVPLVSNALLPRGVQDL